MFLAQAATASTTPAAVTPPNNPFIIGDIHNVVGRAPEDWVNIVIHSVGYIAIAFLVGWVA